MPTSATRQTVGMPTAPNGLAPGLDANGFINPIAFKVRTASKTSAYTVLLTESGTYFDTYGATAAVTFTLPAVASGAGCVYYFMSAADFAMTVASAEGDNIVTFNDVAADSIAMSTTSEIIGGGVKIVGNGTVWFAFLYVNETQTPVIATA